MLRRFVCALFGPRRLLQRQVRFFAGVPSSQEKLTEYRRKLLKELDIQSLTEQQEHELEADRAANPPLSSMSEQRLMERVLQRLADKTIQLNELVNMLHFVEEEASVLELLGRIMPSVHLLEDSEFLFVWQKILAYRPQKLPQVPPPRILSGLELALVILAELYPAHKMLPWVEQVVLWDGEPAALPILCMGLFTIQQSLGEEDRERHQKTLQKANQFVLMRLLEADYPIFITGAALALQLQSPIAVELLSRRKLELQQTTIEQLSLLLINISLYKFATDSKALREHTHMLVEYICELQWSEFMKVGIYVGFWRVLRARPDLKGQWKKFLDKLVAFSVRQYQTFSLDDLTPEEIVEALEACEHHKISNQQLIYLLLVRLQNRLRQLRKDYVVRLVSCLVTYVRVFEEFFVQLRKICEQRRQEFSFEELQQLHRVFERCRVLFNRPFLN